MTKKKINLLEGYPDELPLGWEKRFGKAICDDLLEVLEKNNCTDYHILQIKEKYGSLRWYDSGAPSEWEDHLEAWEYISEHTCVGCGEFPVRMRKDGWISPWCNGCFRKRHLDKNDEELEKLTYQEETDRLLEYLIRFSPLTGEVLIDMKPYYDKIGYKYDINKLVSVDQYRQYLEYKNLLNVYLLSNKKENSDFKPQIIPYEIQELNPFKNEKK